MHYMQEKLTIKENKNVDYKYFPKTKKELKEIISQRINDEGSEVDLNDIDVSNIKDMSNLFSRKNFNGDISNWDVSNVTDMENMFVDCFRFNKDISSWDVSNVKNMAGMFMRCGKFNSDISKWDVSKVKEHHFIFGSCGIEDEYKPKFR